MNRIQQIGDDRRVQAAIAQFSKRLANHVDLIIEVQQIPAPTFAEQQRAAFIEERFRLLGLRDVERDELHNVYGRIRGSAAGAAPVIVSAHSDTVFPADTDLTVKRNGRFIYGPGIGDNATGVAGLFILADAIASHQLVTQSDIWFVANVGEEGLGDLRGMRAVVERFGKAATYLVVEGGSHGYITHEAVGVRRYRLGVRAEGGHAWGSFGQSSAIHVLGRLIAQIDRIEVPGNPKTTYNVGLIEGGTSINTIAREAHMLLDLRSEDATELKRLVKQVEALVREERNAGARSASKYSVTMDEVGHRPSGRIGRKSPIVQWAVQSLEYLDCPRITFLRGSTDANIPLSRGIPAVCIGLTVSANSHRQDEYIDPSYLPSGLAHVLLLMLATAGF